MTGLGFAGIFGFSDRLTSGGFGAVCPCTDPKAAIFCSEISMTGVEGRVDDLLECCVIRSLTLLMDVSPRSGDLELLRGK